MIAFRRSQYGSVVVETFRCLSDNYVSLIGQADSTDRAVVDPGDADRVIEFINQENLRLTAILNTHHHPDHIGGNQTLQEHYRIPAYVAARDLTRISGSSDGLREGSQIIVAGVPITVLEIPGHTEGQIAFFNSDAGIVFVGDTLFSMGCGRIFEGTPAQMLNSLHKLMALPANTKIFVGHEYTLRNGEFAKNIEPQNLEIGERIRAASTAFADLPVDAQILEPVSLQIEMKTNPFLRGLETQIADRLGVSKNLLPSHRELEVFTKLRDMRNRF